MDSFDLRYEPWIPASDSTRTVRMIGLRELIGVSHELLQIEGANPLEIASLYRLAVGLVHHLIGEIVDERDWANAFSQGRFDESQVRSYFESSAWSDGFDLFHPDRPFWQYPGLTNVDSKTGEERPVAVQSLLLEVAAGNNRTLFSHHSDADDFHLDLADAARSLVTAQYYSVGGLNKKVSSEFGYQQSYHHAPFVSGIVSVVTGSNLFETIMLNVLPRQWRGGGLQQLDLGIPPWAERDTAATDVRRDATQSATVPRSYLEFLLPRSRHIRLLPSEGSNGLPVVRQIHIAQGVAWDQAVEPWFVKRRDIKDAASVHPLPLAIDRALWRDSTAYLGWQSRDGKWGYEAPRNIAMYPSLRQIAAVRDALPRVMRIVAYTLANDKAKPLAWRREPLALPATGLTERAAVREIDERLRVAEESGRALQWAIERFHQEAHRNHDTGRDAFPRRKAFNDAAVRLYWAQLEEPFCAALLGQRTHDDFCRQCERIAREAFWSFGRVATGSNVRLYPALARAQQRFSGSMNRIHAGRSAEQEEVKQR